MPDTRNFKLHSGHMAQLVPEVGRWDVKNAVKLRHRAQLCQSQNYRFLKLGFCRKNALSCVRATDMTKFCNMCEPMETAQSLGDTHAAPK